MLECTGAEPFRTRTNQRNILQQFFVLLQSSFAPQSLICYSHTINHQSLLPEKHAETLLSYRQRKSCAVRHDGDHNNKFDPNRHPITISHQVDKEQIATLHSESSILVTANTPTRAIHITHVPVVRKAIQLRRFPQIMERTVLLSVHDAGSESAAESLSRIGRIGWCTLYEAET